MSSSASAEFLDLYRQSAHVFFWIHPVDEKGCKVGVRFAQAAYQKARDLRQYRAEELLDEAVRAELVEKAVYAVSRATGSFLILDAKAYVFTTFARLLDERIAKDNRLDVQTTARLEELPEPVSHTGPISLEDRVYRRQVLDAMRPEDRQLWEKRIVGYNLEELAQELNVTPDCISARARRGLEYALRKLKNRISSARE
jgi:DNA-directed RNA polymerase specialized sigma24 family protein